MKNFTLSITSKNDTNHRQFILLFCFFLFVSNLVIAQTFTNYNPTNTSLGIKVKQIYAIAIDAQGNKWVGTGGGGVSKFDGSVWTPYTKQANGLVDDNVNALAIDAQGVIWIGTARGASKFDGKSWVTVSELGSAYIRAVLVDKQGNKWFGADNGLSKFDGTKWTSYTVSSGLVNGEVKSLAMDDQGNLWVGTKLGVSKFDGSKWTTYQTKNGLASNFVTAIAIDKQGNKWFGTSGYGVTNYDGINWISYLPYTPVNSIGIDLLGNKWFGTSSGVSKFDGTNWKTYQMFNGLAGNWVGAIAFENQGSIWFATDNGVSKMDLNTGLNDMEQQGVQIFPNPATNVIKISGIPENSTVHIYDINGKLLLTSHDHINQINISSFQPGVYTLQIIDNKRLITHKLIKK